MDEEKQAAKERGARIRAMRKALGLNQADLSERLGVDQSTISDIERGSRFAADLLMRISDALKASPALIMRGHDEATWPFKRVDYVRFMSLDDDDRAYLEGILANALDGLSPSPSSADVEAFRQSHVSVKKPTTKRRAA